MPISHLIQLAPDGASSQGLRGQGLGGPPPPPKLLCSISDSFALSQASTLMLEDHHGHLQMSSLRPCGQEAVAPGPKAGWPHCRDSHQTLGLAASLPGDGPTGRQDGEPKLRVIRSHCSAPDPCSPLALRRDGKRSPQTGYAEASGL